MNEMVFNKKEDAMKLLDFLIGFNVNNENHDTYNEIHVKQEDAFIVVHWDQVPYGGEYGGKFVYIDEEHYVGSFKDDEENSEQ